MARVDELVVSPLVNVKKKKTDKLDSRVKTQNSFYAYFCFELNKLGLELVGSHYNETLLNFY